jgi:DNA-binding response OmpR family regulator
MLGRNLVLLIDGNKSDLAETARLLHANSFDTAEADDGLSGLRQFFNLHPDIVIVDLDVSEMLGWKVVNRIREMSDVPVIVTSSEATNEDVTRALDIGIEGFLAKPYDPRELIRRLNSIQNRSMETDEKKWVYQRKGSDYVGEKSQVKLYIWYLRQKLESDPRNPQLIVTRRGLGYTFVG